MHLPEGIKHVLARFGTGPVLRWGGTGLVVLALMIATFGVVADESSLLHRLWTRYTGSLDSRMRAMFVFLPGRYVAVGQLLAVFGVFVLALLVDVPLWGGLIAIIALVPIAYLDSERRKRVELIEDQLDGFMVALANALRATPSIGSAFASVMTLVDDPLQKEIDLAVKEMKLGSTLDQALLHMASRVSSRQLDSALSAILIGRQVGGNLPKVLETTATTLREMKRLDGVIRTKTADGRMQMWVIGALPLVFLVGLGIMWPGYFAPLTQSEDGYLLIAGITVSWVTALIMARRVLAVDI